MEQHAKVPTPEAIRIRKWPDLLSPPSSPRTAPSRAPGLHLPGPGTISSGSVELRKLSAEFAGLTEEELRIELAAVRREIDSWKSKVENEEENILLQKQRRKARERILIRQGYLEGAIEGYKMAREYIRRIYARQTHARRSNTYAAPPSSRSWTTPVIASRPPTLLAQTPWSNKPLPPLPPPEASVSTFTTPVYEHVHDHESVLSTVLGSDASYSGGHVLPTPENTPRKFGDSRASRLPSPTYHRPPPANRPGLPHPTAPRKPQLPQVENPPPAEWPPTPEDTPETNYLLCCRTSSSRVSSPICNYHRPSCASRTGTPYPMARNRQLPPVEILTSAEGYLYLNSAYNEADVDLSRLFLSQNPQTDRSAHTVGAAKQRENPNEDPIYPAGVNNKSVYWGQPDTGLDTIDENILSPLSIFESDWGRPCASHNETDEHLLLSPLSIMSSGRPGLQPLPVYLEY
ncbi:hypothetical protein B0H19DRAFT_1352825 [Mycena capillaripes]|nr:hypothetical protein B0H19DRAFT_1352825 [Mycena capillaripes]